MWQVTCAYRLCHQFLPLFLLNFRLVLPGQQVLAFSISFGTLLMKSAYKGQTVLIGH